MAVGDVQSVGGSYLWGGADSFTLETALNDTEYVIGMNLSCRGGKPETRPGTRIMSNLAGSNLQGCTFFTPNGGTPSHVVAIDGRIYVASYPFRNYVQLPNLQFWSQSRFISWAVCEQSTAYDNSGQLYFLPAPRTVLIIQDGNTRAGYWDGVTNGHINPTPSGSDVTQPDRDGTKVGLWMVWSNNRLWVSRGNQVFASDIGNPFKFTETQYLNEGRAFYLSGNCTGMVATPTQDGISNLLVFTEGDVSLFLSSIQDRTKWLTTESFQRVIIPATGCIAPRSIVNQYGLTWWFSSTGVQNLNSALNQNITSKISYQDAEMAISKQNIGPDMAGICAGFYENYLAFSVPSGDVYNRHTWVLDQAPMEGQANVWPSYWTGWRPVEWSRAVIDGRERVFFVSRDYDGVNRVWEAFLQENTDNGCAITCSLQTKMHNGGSLLLKKFRYAKWFLRDIIGNVSLKQWVLPENGSPYAVGTKEIVATPGQVYNDQVYDGADNNLFRPNRAQTRIIFSEDDTSPGDDCTSCGVQKESTDNIDYAFSMLLVWSGNMGISAYQMFLSEESERKDGKCEENEEGPRSMNFNGCGGDELFPDGNPFGPEYSSTATVCVEYNAFSSSSDFSSSSSEESSSSGGQVCATKTKTSIISQADATRRAECAANWDASFRAGIYTA